MGGILDFWENVHVLGAESTVMGSFVNIMKQTTPLLLS